MDLASNASSDRRDFIGQLAASAVVLATAACASAPAQAPQAPAPAAPPTPEPPPIVPVKWNNEWFDTLKAPHKAVFEQADLDYGSAVSFASRWISGIRDAGIAKAGEFQAVLVLRHEAIPMVLNDAMWEKYSFGEVFKYKPDGDGKLVKKNPIASVPVVPGRPPAPDNPMRARQTIEWFTSHGHICLACNAAFNGLAMETAQRVKGNRAAIVKEFTENLLPGVILQPNGVYATMRAQEAGCAHIRTG